MSNTDPGTIPPPPPPGGDWREMRREERRLRHDAMRGWAGPSIAGVVLLIVGVVLLAQNFGFHVPERWWALLLLIPAIGALTGGIRVYRAGGDKRNEGLFGIIAGIIFLALALGLFFGIGWGIFWPVILVLLGAGLIFRSYQRNMRGPDA